MHLRIPAKTFLVGEYAALCGQPAIVLTTEPCFELKKIPTPGLHGIHPLSPAGRWWTHSARPDLGLQWYDPYHGCGGMGASSAQFLGVYQACAEHQGLTVEPEQLLQDYQRMAVTDSQRIIPSGYDVLAQLFQGCVYIHRQTTHYETCAWPFPDLGYLMIHTGKKLPTHDHLQALDLSPHTVAPLAKVVEQAKSAFDTHNSAELIAAVNAYHQLLTLNSWVAPHTQALIKQLQTETDVLAIKGCGAMGADVMLLLVKQSQVNDQKHDLAAKGWKVLGNSSS
ncbi:MAG: hypothetical protein CK424_03205 [Legionella sp.]|nr:MAG: hypothetical protein CK424_03205 [Legionella sp.]